MLRDKPLAGYIVEVEDVAGILKVKFVDKTGIPIEAEPTFAGRVAAVVAETHVSVRSHAEVTAIILSKLGAQVTLTGR